MIFWLQKLKMKKKIESQSEYASLLLSMGDNGSKSTSTLHLTNSLLHSSLQKTNKAHVQQLSASLMSNNSDYDRQVMKALGIKSTNEGGTKTNRKKKKDTDNDNVDDNDKKNITSSGNSSNEINDNNNNNNNKSINESNVNINTSVAINSSNNDNNTMAETAITKKRKVNKFIVNKITETKKNENSDSSKVITETIVHQYESRYDSESTDSDDEKVIIASYNPTSSSIDVSIDTSIDAVNNKVENNGAKKRRRSRNQVFSEFTQNWNILPAVNNRRTKNRYLDIPGHDEHRFIKPKGISRTSTKSGGFRVQVTKYQSKSDKFSRNAHHFIDAMWLYECAVLMNDRPTELNALLISGNYTSIVSFGLITNELEYYQELGKWINQFTKSNLLKPDEAQISIQVYDNLVFRYKDSESGLEIVSQSLHDKNESCVTMSSPVRSSDFVAIMDLHPEYLG